MIDFVQSLRIVGIYRDNKAVTALEYGVIAGVLGLTLIAVFSHFGLQLSSLFLKIGGSL